MVAASATSPIAPKAALTPIPAVAPGDKPPDRCNVLVGLKQGEFEGTADAGVATFQPMNAMAGIEDEDSTVVVTVVTSNPPMEEICVRIWPGVNGDAHDPTTLPGRPP